MMKALREGWGIRMTLKPDSQGVLVVLKTNTFFTEIGPSVTLTWFDIKRVKDKNKKNWIQP